MTSIKHSNNLCLVPLPPPSDSAESAKLHSKLEALRKVEKLCDFYTNLNTKQNDPKKLLDNLCDGLQTFLGFNPSSKGYDGTGIVYSDLDRLCDGVMGFLSGVLSNIKEHLGQHKNEIEPVIKSLETNKHLGKKGFNDAIGSVVKGVRGYNKAVEQSNKKVSEPITLILSQVNEVFKSNVAEVLKDEDASKTIKPEQPDSPNEEQVKEAERQINKLLRDCKEHANKFNNVLNTERFSDVKNAVNDLNSTLSLRVTNAINSVRRETERLETISGKESTDFNIMQERVREVLKEHGKCINDKITEKVTELVRYLKEAVQKIVDELKVVSKLLNVHVYNLGQWIDDANDAVDKALAKVNKILNEVNESDGSKKPMQIKSTADQIEIDAMLLHGKFDDLKRKLDEEVAKVKGTDGLTGPLKELKELHGTVTRELKSRKWNHFKKGSKDGWELQKTETYKHNIEDAIMDYVGKLATALGEAINAATQSWPKNGKPGYESLKKSFQTSKFPELKNFNTAVIQADKNEFSYNIEIALYNMNKIITNPKFQYHNFLQELKNSFKDKVTNTDADNFLRDLLIATAEKAIGKLQKLIQEQVIPLLEKVDNQVDKLEADAHLERAALETHAREITDKVKTMCAEIRNAAESNPESAMNKLKRLKSLMNDKTVQIKGKAQHGLNQLHTNLSELRKKLDDGAIKLSENFVSGAGRLCEQYLKPVHEHVGVQVRKAQDIIIHHARKHYVTTVKGLLTSFTENVQKDLQGLADEIQKDGTVGHKGFMKYMETKFIATVNSIEHVDPETFTTEHSPLSKSVEILGNAFRLLFTDLKTQSWFKSDYDVIKPVPHTLCILLDKLQHSKHFNSTFSGNHKNLMSKLQALAPTKFGGDSSFLVDSFKVGFNCLAKELGKAYVNTYSGKQYEDADNAKYSKVCFTALSIVKKIFSELRKRSGKASEHDGFKEQQIRKYTALGTLLGDEGFVVSDPDEQNGELQDKRTMTGEQIKGLIIGSADRHVYTSLDDARDGGPLKALYECLETYFRVTHINPPQKPKAPCSVYETLCWFSSLPYTSVYLALTSDGFGEVFGKTEKASSKDNDHDFISFEDIGSQSKEAYPEAITVGHLSDCLTEVCHYSHDLLTTVLGHGHASGIYACDFNTNPHGLLYPSDMNSLLCLLFDLLKRLHHQLYVLYQQCSYESNLGGWRDCWYGKEISGSAWKCNTLQCPNQDCDQRCNQTANQKCRQIPKCGIKSPLQSFLEDGLQGYLPHSLTSDRGQIKCSLSGHSGIPCATPMGFTDIDTVASRRLTGDSLTNVLAEMCGDASSPLSKLCAHMNCLLPSAPKALGDMFGFYLNLLNGWNGDDDKDRTKHKRNAFATAVRAANFENEATDLDITPIFCTRSHGFGKDVKHLTGDLYSLVHCNGKPSSVASHPCGPYLRPICQDTCNTYTEKDADKYLSWIVYLTETFYDLLKKLYDECSANCDSKGSRCRISKCNTDCTATSLPAAAGSAHTENCNSIVQCKMMRPTLLKYGFVHGDCTTLSATSTKRTCKDLCIALKSVVINECKLGDLVYVTIPKFLFTIRAPFIWLNVALWLLSLLYLIHIMVIRLDLLHIKSHLHSPSSHRIAAQSLLAAARVNKLNRVFYLQP